LVEFDFGPKKRAAVSTAWLVSVAFDGFWWVGRWVMGNGRNYSGATFEELWVLAEG